MPLYSTCDARTLRMLGNLQQQLAALVVHAVHTHACMHAAKQTPQTRSCLTNTGRNTDAVTEPMKCDLCAHS